MVLAKDLRLNSSRTFKFNTGQKNSSQLIRAHHSNQTQFKLTEIKRTQVTKATITKMNQLIAKPQQNKLLKRHEQWTAQIVIKFFQSLAQIIVVLLLFRSDTKYLPWSGLGPHWAAQAVSVQRLQVPDLVVIDQQQQLHRPLSHSTSRLHLLADNTSQRLFGNGQTDLSSQTTPGELRPREAAATVGPQAASLINSQPLEPPFQQPQITFECLISFDRRKDKNLIVKWHHDERNEPIYQWIPELNKRLIAPQYRAYIAPIIGHESASFGQSASVSINNATTTTNNNNNNNNQVQLLEAGFRLIRPTKELGGKYTCSAISSQNDDSKSKKMIVYTPPKSFRFNATRADIGAMLANQRDRLIQLTQPTSQLTQSQSQSPLSNIGQMSTIAANQHLPLAYRMRGLDPVPTQSAPLQVPYGPAAVTTISPRMYSTIDYVNVNQQRSRQQLNMLAAVNQQRSVQQQYQQVANARNVINSTSQFGLQMPTNNAAPTRQHLGLKLVCDIDQVFPVPEVIIYRLAKLDGSHPEKLAKLDTRIERDVHTGLFHVQVTSILDDDELQAIRQGSFSASAHESAGDTLYFECLIALTNLELSKYADNKRSIIYRPGHQLAVNSLQENAYGQQDLAASGRSSSSSGLSCRLGWPLQAIAIAVGFVACTLLLA